MRETNSDGLSYKEILLEDYSGVMKPKGQNAIVPKEGTTARDLEPGGTWCFSVGAYLILSVDLHFLFQRHMEGNLATAQLLNLCFKSSLLKGK